jgi:hypothetical protein
MSETPQNRSLADRSANPSVAVRAAERLTAAEVIG